MTPIIYRCAKCEQALDWDEVEEVDVGNYEEFWGSPVWRSEYEHRSVCCNAEVMEEEVESTP